MHDGYLVDEEKKHGYTIYTVWNQFDQPYVLFCSEVTKFMRFHGFTFGENIHINFNVNNRQVWGFTYENNDATVSFRDNFSRDFTSFCLTNCIDINALFRLRFVIQLS